MRTMPRRLKLKLPPLNLGTESFGQRLARLRKERGYTQKELAEKMGIIQVLISDYKRDKLRLHAEMLTRFAQALDVNADDILGLKPEKPGAGAQQGKRELHDHRCRDIRVREHLQRRRLCRYLPGKQF